MRMTTRLVEVCSATRKNKRKARERETAIGDARHGSPRHGLLRVEGDLSSSDGIKHDEVRRIEGTQTKGGLEVRATASRDLEKLRQREQGGGQAAMGLDGNGAGIGGASEGTNLTLFEQLQQNKEDKEEDYEAQLRESRMPKALDDDEIAFLNEQEMRNVREQEARMQQEQRDLDEFRAARDGVLVHPKHLLRQAQQRRNVAELSAKRILW